MELKKLFQFIGIGVIISLILLTYSIIIVSDNDIIKKPLTLSILSKYVKDNNLSVYDKYNGKFLGWTSDLNLTEFHAQLKKDYIYNKSSYDCKYWALTWALYLEKHNKKYKFVSTDNHIFIITYNDNGYIILDEDNLINMEVK